MSHSAQRRAPIFTGQKLRLEKDQLKNCEHNLWRRRRNQQRKNDERSTTYLQVKPKIEMKRAHDHTKTKRKTVAEWHDLRLPLNKFLHSIGRHEDGQCECKTGEETMPHFLFNCSITHKAREARVKSIQKKYHMVTVPSMARVLSTDNRSFNAVCTFLEMWTGLQPNKAQVTPTSTMCIPSLSSFTNHVTYTPSLKRLRHSPTKPSLFHPHSISLSLFLSLSPSLSPTKTKYVCN